MLLGDAPNEISGSVYVLNHLWLSLTMLAVLAIAIIPLCRLPKYREHVLRGNILPEVLSLLGLHFLLPVFLLMVAPVFLKIPLWAVQAFVPDISLTIIVSAALLLIGGFLKGGILWTHKKAIHTRKTFGTSR